LISYRPISSIIREGSRGGKIFSQRSPMGICPGKIRALLKLRGTKGKRSNIFSILGPKSLASFLRTISLIFQPIGEIFHRTA